MNAGPSDPSLEQRLDRCQMLAGETARAGRNPIPSLAEGAFANDWMIPKQRGPNKRETPLGRALLGPAQGAAAQQVEEVGQVAEPGRGGGDGRARLRVHPPERGQGLV